MTENSADHIDNLLVKTMLGEASESEQAIVRNWIRQSVDNESYFRQFNNIWNKSKLPESSSSIDENTAWQKFKESTILKTAPETPGRAFNWRPVFRIAAAILFFAGLGAVIFVQNRPGSSANLVVVSEKHSFRQALSDGSDIYMNRKSKITYSSTLDSDPVRKISLEGEAFFKVASDVRRPFIVTIGDVAVKVLGTSFNIKSSPEKTEIIVATGKVEVTVKEKTTLLLPGHSLTIPKNSTEWIWSDQKDELYSYYFDNQLKADNLPLGKVIEIISEVYDTEIIISNEKLKLEKINTVLDLRRPLRENLNTIHDTMGTSDEERDGIIKIR